MMPRATGGTTPLASLYCRWREHMHWVSLEICFSIRKPSTATRCEPAPRSQTIPAFSGGMLLKFAGGNAIILVVTSVRTKRAVSSRNRVQAVRLLLPTDLIRGSEHEQSVRTGKTTAREPHTGRHFLPGAERHSGQAYSVSGWSHGEFVGPYRGPGTAVQT